MVLKVFVGWKERKGNIKLTVITQNKIGLKKSYTLDPKQIKLTGRNCKGLNLHNLLKIPKSEIIVDVK